MEAAQQLAQKRGGQLVTYRGRGRSTWRCNEGHTFAVSVNRVRRGKWCRSCGSSVGERRVREFFRAYGVPFVAQAVLPILPTRRYDYYFQWGGRSCLVEFDGEQHFRFVRKYHRSKKNFQQAQAVDRVKTYIGLLSGCQVIRIDYSQREAVAWHISAALNQTNPLYVSNYHLYAHITQSPITQLELREYAPRLI